MFNLNNNVNSDFYKKPSLKLNQPYFSSAKSLLPPKDSVDLKPQKNKLKPTQTLEKVIREQYESLEKLIQDSESNGKKLGEGYFGAVFTIPKLDDYVLKVTHKKHMPKEEDSKAKLKLTPSSNYDVNVGQSVGVIGSRYELLKRQHGTSTLIEHNELRAPGNDRMYRLNGTKPYRDSYKAYLEDVRRIPQSGYNQLAATLNKIKNTDSLYFDPNAGNILVDAKKGTFNLVDCQTKREPAENLTGMLIALTDSIFAAVDESAVRANHDYLLPRKNSSVATDIHCALMRQEILQKCLIAAHKENLHAPKVAHLPTQDEAHMPWWQESYIFRIAGLGREREKIYDLLLKNPKVPEAEFESRLKKIVEPRRVALETELKTSIQKQVKAPS